MSVNTEVLKNVFVGNGTAKVFSFAWKLNKKSDLAVYLIDTGASPITTEKVTSNYDVLPTGDSYPTVGGSVIYPKVGDPVDSTKKVVIAREMDILQSDIYPYGNALNPKVVENSLDTIVMEIQQVNDSVRRSLSLPIDAPESISSELPYPEAGSVFMWDDTVSKMISYPIKPKLDRLDQVDAKAQEAIQAAANAAISESNAAYSAGLAGVSATKAEVSAANAFAASAPAYSSTTTYSYPTVVAYTDGYSYRCIGNNIVGIDPPGSTQWVRVAMIANDFFDVDEDGDLVPSLSPTYSADFELDGEGDIMPKV